MHLRLPLRPAASTVSRRWPFRYLSAVSRTFPFCPSRAAQTTLTNMIQRPLSSTKSSLPDLPTWEELSDEFSQDCDIEPARGPLIDEAILIDMAGGRPELSLVWLHGTDREPREIELLFRRLVLPGWRIVLPHAQRRPLTSWKDTNVKTWFDILHHPIRGDDLEDINGMNKSAKRIQELLDHELKRGAQRLFLGGVGEGGAMALHAGLSFPRALSGVISVAGYLPVPKLYPQHIQPIHLKQPPAALFIHGEKDQIVSYSLA
eukprot:g77243.t1